MIWFGIGIACFAVEMLTPHFVLMFFGLGAVAAAVFSLFAHDVVTELIVFSVVSLAGLLLLRSRLLGALWGRARSASAPDAAPGGQPGQSGQVGRTGVVSRDIPSGGEGEVALGGSYWRAVAGEALPEGAAVRVVGHAPDNEILLRVERIPADSRPA
jgi:membrane protein implicated in regulation of membrane protease activity